MDEIVVFVRIEVGGVMIVIVGELWIVGWCLVGFC